MAEIADKAKEAVSAPTEEGGSGGGAEVAVAGDEAYNQSHSGEGTSCVFSPCFVRGERVGTEM